ncbi:hypothetical protein [Streptomyces sp. NPDC049040]|uniref:hypothetical protein n=1 Tax=Streptomyces sp. NPDC049040 TaxID=3365593 RepID=UPI0037227B3A
MGFSGMLVFCRSERPLPELSVLGGLPQEVRDEMAEYGDWQLRPSARMPPPVRSPSSTHRREESLQMHAVLLQKNPRTYLSARRVDRGRARLAGPVFATQVRALLTVPGEALLHPHRCPEDLPLAA